MLNSIAGIDLVHIPYASSSDAGMGLLRKEVDLAVLGDATAAKLLREGQARILARPTSIRSPLFPGVPTLTEQGIALKTDGWVGLVGPAKLDAGIVKKLENAVQDAAKVPGVQEKLANMGVQLDPSDAPTYAKLIKETCNHVGQGCGGCKYREKLVSDQECIFDQRSPMVLRGLAGHDAMRPAWQARLSTEPSHPLFRPPHRLAIGLSRLLAMFGEHATAQSERSHMSTASVIAIK